MRQNFVYIQCVACTKMGQSPGHITFTLTVFNEKAAEIQWCVDKSNRKCTPTVRRRKAKKSTRQKSDMQVWFGNDARKINMKNDTRIQSPSLAASRTYTNAPFNVKTQARCRTQQFFFFNSNNLSVYSGDIGSLEQTPYTGNAHEIAHTYTHAHIKTRLFFQPSKQSMIFPYAFYESILSGFRKMTRITWFLKKFH